MKSSNTSVKTKKVPFSNIYYDPDLVCWGQGNKVMGPNLIARIKLRDPTLKEKRLLKKKFDTANAIYDKYVNKGTCFFNPKRSGILNCKITYINFAKQYVTWKQYEPIAKDYKPAAGKFHISVFIQLIISKEIKIIVQ